MTNIEEKTESLLLKTINKLGYDLYDVIFTKEGKNFYLKIFIDKPEGISLNDCEIVNNAINPLLDEANFIDEQYFLEVSSPGIERIIRKDKHLQENIEKTIEVKLYSAFEGKKKLQGSLKEYNKEKLILVLNNVDVEIDRKNISSMKSVYQW